MIIIKKMLKNFVFWKYAYICNTERKQLKITIMRKSIEKNIKRY